jgi:hypothetical protein
MKKVLFVFVIAVAMVVSSTSNAMNVLGVDEMFGTCVTGNDEECAPVVVVTISMEIGRKSRDCAGFGICKTTVDIDIDFNTISVQDDGNGNLLFIFPERFYQTYASTQFNNMKFILEENYAVDNDVVKALGGRSITLAAGTYSVVKTAKGYETKIRKM